MGSLSGLDLVEIAARFLKNESGATAIEYAIIAGTLSIAIVTTVPAKNVRYLPTESLARPMSGPLTIANAPLIM